MRLHESCQICGGTNWCGRPCAAFYKHTLGKEAWMANPELPLYFDKRPKKDQDPDERTVDKNPLTAKRR